MTIPAVVARNLRKKYRLFPSPMARLKEALHPLRKRYHHDFWALDDVSFDIEAGETFGIIGRNGSGKSTLLQVIAGILEPTSGALEVNGRVAALLELGAGFNPDFTGRENVLLNGAIMRVPAEEMVERMPLIEAFADIGEFFDQPVRTYSSGMFARVAFAAAINVDPDILIVDEALSVGDAKFQHKCYERMRQFSQRGRTVLFVTHAIDVVVSNCTRAVVLHHGKIEFIGEPRTAVDRYLDILFGSGGSPDALSLNGYPDIVKVDDLKSSPATSIPITPKRIVQALSGGGASADLCPQRASYNPNETRIVGPQGGAHVVDYVIEAEDVIDATDVAEKSRVEIGFKVVFDRPIARPIFGIALKTLEGIVIYASNTFMMGRKISGVFAGETRIASFSFVADVHPGGYFLDFGVAEVDGTPGGRILEIRRSVAHLVVKGKDFPTFDGACDLHADFELLG